MDDPIQAIAQSVLANRCVAFVGPGLTENGGSGSRADVVRRIVEMGGFPPDVQDEILPSLSERSVDEVLESLCSVSSREHVVELLQQVYRASALRIPASFTSLCAIPFRHCIAATPGRLVDDLFSDRKPIVLRGLPGEVDTGSALFDPTSFVLVELLGSIASPETLRLTTAEAASLLRRDGFLARAIGTILSSSTVVFVGMTVPHLDDVLDKIPQIAEALQGSEHFAFVDSGMLTSSRISGSRFLARYGIRLIAVSGERELSDRLREIERLTRPPGPEIAATVRAFGLAPGSRFAKALRLANVGPFEQLALALDPSWTVILGDNGVGKSTILRAIALALRGPDGVPDANLLRRLLKSGATSGTIELDIADELGGVDTHRVELARQSDGSVSAKLSQFSVVEQGTWVVAAFPALRGISVQRVKGPSSDVRNRVTIADIDPLITERVDSRLDDLQQWLVNLSALGRTDLIEVFFALVNEFFPTHEIAFTNVSKSNFEVMVKSVDGEIPLDQLSQGMSSLLSWVGFTLQRMFEVYARHDAPQNASALVIVDEIDAHLHPEWQRQLVPIVRKHLPNVQVVATTHSPLIVSALEPQNIRVASRDENGTVTLASPEEDMRGLRADQVLTSRETFGLPSSRSVHIEEKLEELDALYVDAEESAQTLARRDELAAEVETLAVPGETLVMRDAIRRRVEERTQQLTPDDVFRGSEELDALLEDVPGA
jgi:energy-coupling factor transporter ATP-binding protein EcfA2